MTDRRKARSFAAFLLLASAVALIASLWAVPVGPVEEHFALGQRLHATGSLGTRLLRPPGFPAFVAATLRARDALAAVGLLPGSLCDDALAVIVAQRLALLLFSSFVFRAALRETSPFGAFCLATLFSANPLSIVLAGALSYPLLDMLLVALGTMMLVGVTGAQTGSLRPALVAGGVWGLAALVRPVALALPAVALAVAVLRRPGSWRTGLRLAGALALGMALIVGPYALRNFVLTGRLVPVCAQGGFALWGSSVAKPAPGEPYVAWVRIWGEQGMPIYARVTGAPEYSIERLTQNALALNEAFGRAALANIAHDPGTYLFNVANNLWRFPLDTSEWWWRRLLWVNAGRPLDGDGPAPPASATRTRIGLANGFMIALSLSGLAGILIGLNRSDPWAEPILVAYAVLWVGNALTFTMSRYTYARLPLLILALGMLLRAPGPTASKASATLARLAIALAGALVVLALWTTLGLVLAHP